MQKGDRIVRNLDAPEPDVPEELRVHLDDLIRRYRALRRKTSHLMGRRYTRMRVLNHARNELQDCYDERLARLKQRREEVTAEFLALWAEHFPRLKHVKLPSGIVHRRRDVKVKVLDKEAVIDALDRLGRLDLRDEVVDEKGVRKLAREGKLADLPETALKVVEKQGIQVFQRKED